MKLSIGINHNNLQSAFRPLKESSEYTTIHLRKPGFIGFSQIIEQLANALASIRSELTNLDLSYNQIADQGAIALSDALHKDTALIDLHINGNTIEDLSKLASQLGNSVSKIKLTINQKNFNEIKILLASTSLVDIDFRGNSNSRLDSYPSAMKIMENNYIITSINQWFGNVRSLRIFTDITKRNIRFFKEALHKFHSNPERLTDTELNSLHYNFRLDDANHNSSLYSRDEKNIYLKKISSNTIDIPCATTYLPSGIITNKINSYLNPKDQLALYVALQNALHANRALRLVIDNKISNLMLTSIIKQLVTSNESSTDASELVEAITRKVKRDGAALAILYYAVLNDDCKLIDKIFNLNPNIIDAQDKEGNTALHHAVKRNKINAIVKLIELGADINIKPINGTSALLHASRGQMITRIADTIVRNGNLKFITNIIKQLIVRSEHNIYGRELVTEIINNFQEKDKEHIITEIVKVTEDDKVRDLLLVHLEDPSSVIVDCSQNVKTSIGEELSDEKDHMVKKQRTAYAPKDEEKIDDLTNSQAYLSKKRGRETDEINAIGSNAGKYNRTKKTSNEQRSSHTR